MRNKKNKKNDNVKSLDIVSYSKVSEPEMDLVYKLLEAATENGCRLERIVINL